VFAKLHSHRSHRSQNVQTCQRSNAQFASRVHLRDVSTSFKPNSHEIISFTSYASLTSSKSLPVNLFADPHPLNPVPSIFYKNIGGQGATFLQRFNVATHFRSIPFVFTFLRTPLRNGRLTTLSISITSTLFSLRRGVYPPSEHQLPFTYSLLPTPNHLSPLFSYSYTLFCTFLHSRKTQPFYFQAIPHSLHKTPGGGEGRLLKWRRSLLRSHTQHDNAVRRDLCAEACGGFAEVLFGPEVADGGGVMGGIPEIFPGDRNFGVGGAAIQQDDGAA
jgi:hypothetical protein